MSNLKKFTQHFSVYILLLVLMSFIVSCENDGVEEPIPPESEQVEDPVGDEVTAMVDLYVAESVDGCGENLTIIEREVTYREGEIIAATLNELFALQSLDGSYNAISNDSLRVEEVNIDMVGEGQTIFVEIDGTPDFPTDQCGRDQIIAQLVETVQGLNLPTTGVSFSFDGVVPDWLVTDREVERNTNDGIDD